MQEKEDDSGVYVVHAVQNVTKAEPLVQGEQEAHDDESYTAQHSVNSLIDENALQESRWVKSA